MEVKIPPVQGVAIEGSGRGQRYLTAVGDDVMATPTETKHDMSAHTHTHNILIGYQFFLVLEAVIYYTKGAEKLFLPLCYGPSSIHDQREGDSASIHLT